ncbi:epoxide hydrolase 1 isoform e [Homo sapiens]|uniref:epoxide hydrolase 1 isoform e n=1 Tax=Homo sapiens TaxID=9606 RepID=UPI0013967134|nr:epoxide hydrolase 1 isoform e precursor [Homo sapiens]
MWLEILLTSVLGFAIYWFISRDKEETLPLEDGWWGPGTRSAAREDDSIRPFKVETSDEEIHDLHQRIDKFRFTPPLEDSCFHYGFNSNYLKKVISYWRNEFDWKKQVEILNRYPHFKTKIEGSALNDSPVGLAAYILEKFSTWTNTEFRYLEDGGLERKFSLDDLLTNVMLYWTTGTIISSQRFYKENLGQGWMTQKHERMKVYVPTGFSAFPFELLHTPEKWVRFKYPKLISYSYMVRGGHFAAFEEPELLAQDIRKFLSVLERQ